MKEGNNRVKKPTIPTVVQSVDVPHYGSDNTPDEGNRMGGVNSSSRTSTINNIDLLKNIPTMKEGNIRVVEPNISIATPPVVVSHYGSDNTSSDSSRMRDINSASTTDTIDDKDLSKIYQL